MKSVFKSLACSLMVLFGFTALAASEPGNCMSGAVEITPGDSPESLPVTLVNEWDEWFGEFTDSGAYYLKMICRKNEAYTVWIEGGSAGTMYFSVDVDMDDESAPGAMFAYDYREVKGETTAQIYYLEADEWWEDDPDFGTYYIVVEGDIGETCTLNYQIGIHSFAQEGEADNPRQVVVRENSVKDDTKSLIDGEFYYSADLEAGRKYRFRTMGGLVESPLMIEFKDGPELPVIEQDPLFATDVKNSAILVYPKQNGRYTFAVYNKTTFEQTFNLAYMVFHPKTPAEHDIAYTFGKSGEIAENVIPGRLYTDPTNVYDEVIDESLCSIKLAKGENWVFETQGAKKPLMMRLYDAQGNVLAENKGMGNGNLNVRAAMTASADGIYYIGVCNPALDYSQIPSVADKVSLLARKADEIGDYDAFDRDDDEPETGNELIAYPGSSEASVVKTGKGHGPHWLNAGDWYDCFRIACRGKVTYAVKAAYASEARSDVGLAVAVYKEVNGVRVRIPSSQLTGSLTPVSEGAENPLVFTPDEDSVYVLCLYAAKGKGLDFPPYTLHAMAYYPGADLGLIRVLTQGVPDGIWVLGSSSMKYVNGDTVCVPVGKTVTVAFPTVEGFKLKNKVVQVSDVKKWTGNEADIRQVIGLYTDEYDPADDVFSGYVTITPQLTTTKHRRTLWEDDDADHFLVRSRAGVCYNFALIDTTTGDVPGDARFSIANAKSQETLLNPLVENATECSRLLLGDGAYMIKVSHANAEDKRDSTYTFVYNMVNPGVVRFEPASAVKISEDAPFAELTVVRSSPEGAVRVHWATQQYTAEPGKEYYPDQGVLAWAAGDMSPKKIRVRLIPDVVATWDEMKYFAVKIWPMEADCLEDDEYPVSIEGPKTIAVKLAESSEKNPGEIVFVEQCPAVRAGDVLKMRLRRVGGIDGQVSVAVVTQPNTAKRDTDFVPVQSNFVWEAGDRSDRTIEVPTMAVGSHDAKSFFLKCVALTTGEYVGSETPILPARLSVALDSEVVHQTFDEASAEATARGVGLRNLTTAEWYVDAAGCLRSQALAADRAAKMKFVVSGPGLLVVEPKMLDYGPQDTFLAQVSGGPVFDCSDNKRKVVSIPAGDGKAAAFVVRSVNGGTYLSFSKLENGFPYKMIRYSSVQPVEPSNGAIVPLTQPRLTWSQPVGKTDEKIYYRVRIGATSADPTTITTVVASGLSETTCSLEGVPLKAGRKYWWMVDYAYSEDDAPVFTAGDWVAGPSVWSFAAVSKDAPISAITSGTDVFGNSVAGLVAAGKKIELVQGMVCGLFLGAEEGTADQLCLVAGELPPGLKIKSGLRIAGIPTVAGDYEAIVGCVGGGVVGTTMTLRFHVAEIGSAAGKFCGIFRENGTSLTNRFPRVGSVSFTANAEGRISAKASVAGLTHVFETMSGYSASVDPKPLAEGQKLKLQAELIECETFGDRVYTNRLVLTVGSAAVTNLVALGERTGMAELTLNVPDAIGVQEDIVYTCDLVRLNSDSSPFVAAMSKFAGYYTMALVPDNPRTGEPTGNGIVTMTVGTDGLTKVAGRFADGKSYTCSAFANLVGDISDPYKSVLVIPFAVVNAPYSYGGTIEVMYDEEQVGGEVYNAAFVNSLAELEWNKEGPASTPDGLGFTLAIRPTGGYYSTVYNLQAYYLNQDLTVEAEPVVGLPADMLPEGSYTIDSTPRQVPVTLDGNDLSIPGRVFVKEDASRVNLAASINPCNVKMTFNRATGSAYGTFNVLSDDGKTQKTVATDCKHYGVLIMHRDEKTPLDADVWSGGFGVVPVTDSWSLSLPFNIRSVDVDRDWTEIPTPNAE